MRLLLSLVKKDWILMWRNPQEWLILLVMPIVLITILGYALGDILSGGPPVITGKVALVLHSDEETELERFRERLDSMHIPQEAKAQMFAAASMASPVAILKDDIFANEELSEMLTLEEIEASQLGSAREEGQYSAIIEVPKHFTSHLLDSLFFDDGTVPELVIYTNEGKELSASIVEDIIKNFQEQMTLWSLLIREDLATVPGEERIQSTVETLNEKKPISAFSYYTIGMGVMFILFIASNISSRNYLEKEIHVYGRLITANVPKGLYFASTFFSTIVLGMMQLCLLFGFSALFYQVHWPNMLAFFAVTLALSSAVGGISVLLMAIVIRMETETASKLFLGGIIAVLSFVGGSFVPVGNISAALAQVGRLTPNGAAMSAYMKILLGADITGIAEHLAVLVILTICLGGIAWLIFPRKEWA